MAKVCNPADFDLEENLEESELEGHTVRADDVPGAKQGEWTYDSYAKIPDDGKRYEVIEGVLYLMASPNVKHQAITLRISSFLLINYEYKGLGRVIASPIEVKLDPKYTVQPDVVVISTKNSKIIKRKNVVGSPDLVVEVASRSTGGYDRTTKKDFYAKYGVKEYWMVNATRQTVEVLVLEQEQYVFKGEFSGDEIIPSTIVPDFSVKVADFFPA
jgi:Uma2 family endonuclease